VSGKTLARPQLAGWHAVVLHRPHPATDNVVRQLERLGLSVKVVWPDFEPVDAQANIVFFDADMGCDEQFPWAPGAAPMPLVALIGSEAPGRIEWALAQGANAHLLKPVTSAGVYSVLLIAAHGFENRQRLSAQLADLTERVRKRPVVARALLSLMQDGLDAAAAMQRLRALAMEQRLTVEDAAEAMVAGVQRQPESLRRRAD
jgi:AmiR/NasT family two-component response regulator